MRDTIGAAVGRRAYGWGGRWAAVFLLAVVAGPRAIRGEGPPLPFGDSVDSISMLADNTADALVTPFVDADLLFDPNARVGVDACPGPVGPYDVAETDVTFADGPWDAWGWQLLPDGLIYRSYLAGVKESRISAIAFHEKRAGWLLDVALGGRVGILRYGTTDSRWPEGWQVDIEGAAFPRLNLEKNWDVEATDFRFGVPLTYGAGPLQTKLAYYHLSSHLGDELAIRHPATLRSRINFSRDVIVVGASVFPHPAWRLYAEVGWAMASDGGSEPWEFQFGTEISDPYYQSFLSGAPFLAVNAHLREELGFGGHVVVQAGWQWVGQSGHRLRVGGHYLGGKSSQFQFFDSGEQQVGAGLWYDY